MPHSLSVHQNILNHNQNHLLDNLCRLSLDQKNDYEQELFELDLVLLEELFSQTQNTAASTEGEITPLDFELALENPKYSQWLQKGEELIAQGAVGAFLVAGGQGSRLGFDGPKGIYSIDLPSQKSLFQLQAERLLNLEKRYGRPIPWCIMTSPLNHQATVDFFENHNFFGLNPGLVKFFPQSMIPALDVNGKILRSGPANLALVPDGNGGCFRALAQSGALDWFSSFGVEYVFLNSVDNALVKVCDPAFMGALALEDSLSASKVVSKANAQEKVGIFAYHNGNPMVIEYSDLDTQMREATQGDKLVYDGANIAVHAFSMKALRQLEAHPLPWHNAFKKVDFWDPQQGFVKPEAPNAWKFEQFLFDAFPILGQMLAYGVLRNSEFAPVKNATGDDSPASARKLLGQLHRQWLQEAGGQINDALLYEIAPELSYGGENLNAEKIAAAMGQSILSFSG